MACIENIYTARGNIDPVSEITIVHQPRDTRINSQSVWSLKISGRGKIINSNLAVDKNNDILFAGTYQSDINDPINFYNSDDLVGQTINSSGKTDYLIAKYTNNGYLIWVTTIVAISNEPEIFIDVDHLNNILVTGRYQTDKLIVDDHYLPIPPGPATFLIKYDTNKKFIWANHIVASSNVSVNGITIGNTNDIFLTGYYSGTRFCENDNIAVNFFNSNKQVKATLPETVGVDSFLAKYNTDGGVQWVTRFAANNLTIFSKNIATDITTLNNNIVVCGIYQADPLVFYDQPNGLSLTPVFLNNGNNAFNIFVSIYDNSGKNISANKISGSFAEKKVSVATDRHQDIIITGTYDRLFMNNNEFESKHGTNIFLARFESDGSFKWVRRITGRSENSSQDIAVDQNDNTIVIGSYESPTIVFHDENNRDATLTNNNDTNSFVAQYHTMGHLNWAAKQAGSSIDRDRFDFDESNIVLTDNESNLIVTNNGLVTDLNNNLIISGVYTTDLLDLYSSTGIVIEQQKNIGGTEGFLTQYINYGQDLNLLPSLMPTAVKRIVSGSSYDSHTVISAKSNTLVDSNGRAARGLYLIHPAASVLLIWYGNRWIVQELDNSVIIY